MNFAKKAPANMDGVGAPAHTAVQDAICKRELVPQLGLLRPLLTFRPPLQHLLRLRLLLRQLL